MKFLRKHRKPVLLFSMCFIIIFGSIAGLLALKARSTDAAWFDDTYAYRQIFSFTHNASITTDRAVTFSLDTAELITDGVMQSDCDDTRFTDTNGRLLRYELTGSCNNAATTYEVVFPSIENGTNTAYVYYGNPTATSGSTSVSGITALTPSGGDPAITTRTAEEKGTTPLLFWNFDEGYGTTVNDSSSYDNDGTFKGSGEPVIQTEELCFVGKCVKFDGSNDYVRKTYSSDTDLNPGTGSFTISAWIKHSSTISGTDVIVSRADGVNGVGYKLYMDSSGFICFGIDQTAGSFPVDSACSTTSYADSKWHLIHGVKSTTSSITLYIDGKQIAQDASITATTIDGTNSPFYVGLDADATSNPWDGFIDEVKYYNYAKSGSSSNNQIATDYANRGSGDQVAASFGYGDTTQALSSGLVGYWKMDETSNGASSVDSSGNTSTLTDVATSVQTAGKFANGTDFESGSTQYKYVADNTALSVTGDLTMSAWIKPESVTSSTDFMIMGKWQGSSRSYSLYHRADKLVIVN